MLSCTHFGRILAICNSFSCYGCQRSNRLLLSLFLLFIFLLSIQTDFFYEDIILKQRFYFGIFAIALGIRDIGPKIYFGLLERIFQGYRIFEVNYLVIWDIGYPPKQASKVGPAEFKLKSFP